MYGTYNRQIDGIKNSHRPSKIIKLKIKNTQKKQTQKPTGLIDHGPRARDDDLFLVIKHQDHPITFIGEPSNIL